tara:strand:+ start:7021 stop:8406 length:1386 start_codon:yes stop_codon:yes gene_type:complete
MSYRDPKYINKSVQGSFDKLQNQINTTVAQVKEREYQEQLAEDARKNEITLASNKSSQAQTLRQSKANTLGDENTLGTVGTFFKDYPKRAAEITTEMAKLPRPENYYELEAELQMINDSPNNMKDGLTNLESQFTITNPNNIDPHQNPGLLLASQVFNNTSGYTEANGYTMGMENNINKKTGRDDGTFNYIFKFDPDVARANLIEEKRWDSDTNSRVDYTDEELEAKLKEMEYPNGTFQLNSGALKNMQANDESLITEIGHMNKSVNEALVSTNIIAGGEFGDDGEWKTGTGTFDINRYGMDGDEGIEYGIGPDGNKFQMRKIDPAKVEIEMSAAIDAQIASYLDPKAGDDAGARGLWNMRLRIKTDATHFDEAAARDAFKEIPKTAKMSTEDLKKMWTKAVEAWGYDGPISKPQRAVFKKLYTDHIVDDTVRKMNQQDMKASRWILTDGKKVTWNPASFE